MEGTREPVEVRPPQQRPPPNKSPSNNGGPVSPHPPPRRPPQPQPPRSPQQQQQQQHPRSPQQQQKPRPPPQQHQQPRSGQPQTAQPNKPRPPPQQQQQQRQSQKQQQPPPPRMNGTDALPPQGRPQMQRNPSQAERNPRIHPPPTKTLEFKDEGTSGRFQQGTDGSMSSVKSLSNTERNHNDEWVEINDDIYNMFFLSKIAGQAFWYGIYIFVLKLALYTFLAMDAIDLEQPTDTSNPVLVTQFFMLPVAVAMQDDLIATYFLVANIKYSPLIKMENPHATKWKFHAANMCRGIDGMYSLFVNFIILIKATEVLSLFLNFAALQFLQTLDNIALRLCADGYLTERLEEVANHVMTARLPNKNNQFYRSLDSVMFLSTFVALLIAWAVISFG